MATISKRTFPAIYLSRHGNILLQISLLIPTLPTIKMFRTSIRGLGVLNRIQNGTLPLKCSFVLPKRRKVEKIQQHHFLVLWTGLKVKFAGPTARRHMKVELTDTQSPSVINILTRAHKCTSWTHVREQQQSRDN